MTEAEAKTKWCPFARTIYHGSEPCNSSFEEGITDVSNPEGTYWNGQWRAPCIASACMAWRWRYLMNVTTHAKERVDDGFCGLAAQPIGEI